ncbi:MAG: M20 family peptidase [Candidatus Hydrogenedens sp.]
MKRYFIRLIQITLIFILILVFIILFKTEQARWKRAIPVREKEPLSLAHKQEYAYRLAKALTFKTISYQEEQNNNWDEYKNFIHYLEETFPQVHSTLKKDIVNKYSLLFTWEGKKPSLPPALFLAHYDVVPVEEGTENQWKYPPFGGIVAEEYIWGRGAIDMKCNVIALLESVNYWIQQGYQPERTLLFAFGHDEEVGGRNGAQKIAEFLKERGISPEFSLDEGMAINEGIIPGINGPVALIGIAEKGYLSLQLSVSTQGGHSSAPSAESSIGILASAICKIEQNRMPAKLVGPIRWMFEDLSPYMNFPMRMVCSNLWLFDRLMTHVFARIPSANSAIRTTFAPTLFHAGEKENVLPTNAYAVVNIRMLPGDTTEKVTDYTRKVVNDKRIEIKQFSPEKTDEASPISDRNAEGYKTIVKTIHEVWGDIPVASALTLAGTDSVNYVGVVKNLYRFQPFKFTKEDIKLIHATNERLHIDNYMNGIEFFIRLLKNVGK